MNIKHLLSLAFTLIFSTSLFAQAPFITTWNTENEGVSANNQITIPTTGTGYNYSIYWKAVTNDAINGTISNATGNVTITFPSPGIYEVQLSGIFPRIYFSDQGDKRKILSVKQWGNISWTSMERAFEGCYNLDVLATDAPDLSNVISLNSMFLYCSEMNGKIGHWDVSKVKTMKLMFCYANKFNQDIGNWNVGNVTDMTLMFQSAGSFNQDIGDWDVSKVTSMYGLFYWPNVFNQDISRWNVSNVTDMSYMFLFNQKFNQEISGWNVSKVTKMNSMFEYATSFNQDLSSWNISNITGMDKMLNNSGMSIENYDATLIGWSKLNVQSGVKLGASNVLYCSSESARQSLISNDAWTIQGDLKDCISIQGTLYNFSTSYGTPSSVQSFTIFAATLTSNLVVQVPSSYELSMTTSGPYQSNLSLIPINGKVSTSKIYIRLKATSTPSTVSAGEVTLSTTGFTTEHIAIPSGTVTKALLTIVADNVTKIQGASNPLFTVSYNGFKNSDNASALGCSVTPVTIADENSVVGEYAIMIANCGFTNTNYTYKFVNGTLAITPITSTKDQSSLSSLIVYPNPSSGRFNLSIPDNELKSVRVINMLGEEEMFYTNDVQTKFSGLVILEIRSTNGVVVIQRMEVVQ